MKEMRTMIRQSFYLSLLFGLISPALAEVSEQGLGAFTRPAKAPFQIDYTLKRVKGEKLKVLARMKTFEEWKQYEDERVKFSYPAHGGIELQVEERRGRPDDAEPAALDYVLRVEGEVMMMMRLRLKKAEWLNDGVCLCGARVYERYRVSNGQLFRYSFLEDGTMKRMQVL